MRDALPDPRGPEKLRVIGVGNAWRGDDAAGLLAARLLGDVLPDLDVRNCEGDPVGLLDAWDGADTVWVVDAVSSGAKPGTVHRLEATEAELPRDLFGASTHVFGLAEAVELGRALDRLPERLVVFGVEGSRFNAGDAVSPEVERAAADVAAQVEREVEECTRRR